MPVKRRKNDTRICATCKRSFECFKWSKQRYCSPKCSYRRAKRAVECETCGSDVLVSESRARRNERRGLKFYCNMQCYRLKHKLNKRLKRNTAFFQDLLERSACGCGVSEIYLLTIHHRDGDNKHNNLENLEIVCANCHIRRHLKLKNNKWVYHTKSLTPREILEDLSLSCSFSVAS